MRYQNLLLSTLLCLSLSTVGALAIDPSGNDIISRAVAQFEKLEASNCNNKEAGKEHLNQYILSLVTDEKCLDYRPKVLKSDFNELNKLMRGFNNSRKDGLFFYVLVLQDEVFVKEDIESGISLKDLPKGTNLDFGRNLTANADFKSLDSESFIKARDFFEIYDPKIIGEIRKNLKKDPVIFYVLHEIIFYNAAGGERLYTCSRIYTSGKLTERGIHKKIQSQHKQGWVELQEDLQGKPALKDFTTPTHEKVKLAITNIITTIQLEYDMNAATNKGVVDCGDDITKILKGQIIDSEKIGRFTEELAATGANLLDKHSPEQEFGSEYFVVDKPSLFRGYPNSDGVFNKILTDAVFYEEILPDILNKIDSKYKVRVVSFSSNGNIIPYAQREEFAEAVYVKSKVAKQANTILIVIPYYKCIEEATRDADSPWLLMPCAYGPDEAMNALMNAALSRDSGRDGITLALQQIPQRCKVYMWRILWNGDILSAQKNGKPEPTILENVTGHLPVEVVLFQDTRLDDLNAVKKKHQCEYAGVIGSTVETTGPIDEAIKNSFRCYELLQKDIDQILSQPAKFKQVKENSNLRISSITWQISSDYAAAYGAMKIGNVAAMKLGKKPKMDDGLFYGKENTVDKFDASMIFTLLDVTGMILSIVGADFITDAAGLYVANVVGDQFNAGIYSIAVAIPVLNGAALRAVVQGKDVIVRMADKTYKAVARKTMHGLFYLKVATSELSELTLFALRPEICRQVARYANEIPSLAADVEKVILDGKHLQKLNDDTYLLQRYKAARDENPITLEKYLDAEKIFKLSSKVEWLPKGDVRVFADGVTEHVGSGFLNDKGFIEMTIDVKIGPGNTEVAKGGDVFEKIFNELKNKHGESKIKGIKGNWLDDPKLKDNLISFNDGILDYVSKGMSKPDAAVKAARENTFTGVMAGKESFGFTEIEKIEGMTRSDGTYRDAVVFFVKPLDGPGKIKKTGLEALTFVDDAKMIATLGIDPAALQAAARLTQEEGVLKVIYHTTEDGKILVRSCDGTSCGWVEPEDMAKWITERKQKLQETGKKINEIRFFSCGPPDEGSPIQAIVNHMPDDPALKYTGISNNAGKDFVEVGVDKTGNAVALSNSKVEWMEYRSGKAPSPTGKSVRQAQPDEDVLSLGGRKIFERSEFKIEVTDDEVVIFTRGKGGLGLEGEIGNAKLTNEGYIKGFINVYDKKGRLMAKADEVLEALFDKIKEIHGIDAIKGIEADWMRGSGLPHEMSDLLDHYNRIRKTIPDDKIAASKTIIGRKAEGMGFTEIEIRDAKKAAGSDDYDIVTVIFKRPTSTANISDELRGTLTAIGEDQIVLKSADILKRLAPPKNGELYVVVHSGGSADKPFRVFENSKWVEINSEALATRLKLDGLKEAKIFSCGCEQVKELAERLGKESGLKIQVPNVPITLIEVEGKAVSVGKQEGHWARFNGKTGEWEVPFENHAAIPQNLRIRKATDAEADNLAFLGMKSGEGEGKRLVFEPSMSTSWGDRYKKSLQKLAAAVKTKQGYFDVYIEMQEGRFVLIHGFRTEILTPKEVTTVFFENGYKKGTPIRLIIKDADKIALDPNGLIQPLADELGVKTEAYIFTPDEIMQTEKAVKRINDRTSTRVLFPRSGNAGLLGLVGAKKEGDALIIFTLNNKTYQNLLISGQRRSDGVIVIKNINENLLKEKALLESIRSAFSTLDNYSGTAEIKGFVVTWSRRGTPLQWKDYQAQVKNLKQGQPVEIAAGQTSIGQALQGMAPMESPQKISESLLKFLHIKSVPAGPDEVSFIFSKDPLSAGDRFR
jgi:hypothetical protein